MLQMNQVSVEDQSGGKILNNVSLSISNGTKCAIVGKNGSGKTTLLRTINQLLPRELFQTEGQVLFDETDLTTLGRKGIEKLRGEKIGYIFQQPSSYFSPVNTVGKQFKMTLQAHQMYDSKKTKEKTRDLFIQMGLDETERILSSYPMELSGGMAQRIAIALTILLEPDIILADEITSALDVRTQDSVLGLLDVYSKKSNGIIMFVTHDFSIAEQLADSIIVMDQGEIIESNSRAEILNKPKHNVTKNLIEASYISKWSEM